MHLDCSTRRSSVVKDRCRNHINMFIFITLMVLVIYTTIKIADFLNFSFRNVHYNKSVHEKQDFLERKKISLLKLIIGVLVKVTTKLEINWTGIIIVPSKKYK